MPHGEWKKLKCLSPQHEQDIVPDEDNSCIIQAIKQYHKELETGVLLTVNENKARVRILPLR
jgi:hypothetical protein